jgi:hypothetical protein
VVIALDEFLVDLQRLVESIAILKAHGPIEEYGTIGNFGLEHVKGRDGFFILPEAKEGVAPIPVRPDVIYSRCWRRNTKFPGPPDGFDRFPKLHNVRKTTIWLLRKTFLDHRPKWRM